VDNQEITRLNENQLSEVQRKFAYVFQGGALFDSLTVGQNIAFGLYNLKKDSSEKINETVGRTLSLVGLSGIENLKPCRAVGGHAQARGDRRAIAIAPKYLLYDETHHRSGPDHVDIINDLIISLQKKLGNTAIGGLA